MYKTQGPAIARFGCDRIEPGPNPPNRVEQELPAGGGGGGYCNPGSIPAAIHPEEAVPCAASAPAAAAGTGTRA